MYNQLRKYAEEGTTAFHMPGHKLGKGFPQEFLKSLAELDVTEIPGTDNLHYPEGVILESQKLAAEAFGADETFFLINGATSGIHGMIMSICKPLDKLIVARDCHKSVISGMMLAGVQPVHIKPRYNSEFGIPSCIDTLELENTLTENPEAVGVLITRPSYYGMCSDIEKIAEITHSFGKILMVDEAHGAHLCFNKRLPISAMTAGADICVQSAHKTLPAFTQGAYLHVRKNRIDIDRLRFNLGLLQSSSPSYIIMASLDMARAIMHEQGENKLEKLLKNIGDFKSKIGQLGLQCLSKKYLEFGSLDETRIVINMRTSGLTGYETEKILRKDFNIQVEMSDLYNIACIATISDDESYLEKLYSALERIVSLFKKPGVIADIYPRDIKIPEQRISLRDTMFKRSKKIHFRDAAGSVSHGMLTPYPPGIPVVCPGEVIDKSMVDYLAGIVKYGGTVNGMGNNGEINVID